MKYNPIYQQEKQKFFPIRITDGELEIHVLKSVQEFYEEGKEMNHCVYSAEYFREKDSLILSARKDNQRIETIEVDLNKYKIIQSRGKSNEYTSSHEKILNLVNENMNLIRKANC